MKPKVAAIEKLLRRYGYTTYNCDRSRNRLGSSEKVREHIESSIKSCRVFLWFVSKAYVNKLSSNAFVKSPTAVQFEVACGAMSDIDPIKVQCSASFFIISLLYCCC